MAYNSNNYSYFNPSTTSYSQKYDDRPYSGKSSSNYSGYTGYSTSSGTSGYSKESFNTDGTPHDVIKGQVTQLFTSFGYINDNIMFCKSSVSGPMVALGDSVIVEVSYHPNNPVKYKGEKVIRCDDKFSGYSSSSRMNTFVSDRSVGRSDTYESRKRQSPNKPSSMNLAKKQKTQSRTPLKTSSKFQAKSKVTSSDKPRKAASIDVKSSKRSSVDRSLTARQSKSKSRDTEKKDDLIHSKPTAVNTKLADSSMNTLMVFTGDNLSIRELDTVSLKFKYKGIQIPNQFFHLSLKYQQNFPLNHPLKLGNKCQFKVMDKRVICPDKFTEDQLNKEIDPFDADSTFTAKVILMSMDELVEVYKQTVKFAEEFDTNISSKLPITKAIRFLVASASTNGTKDSDINYEFAIGGRWSPSLDGENPEENPQVLINTAIRTTKSLTGIDLSKCTAWHKFLEFHYYRPMVTIEKKKTAADNNGDLNDGTMEEVEYREPRMETVVYYLPDVWNIFPSSQQWREEILKSYQNQLTSILCPPPPPPPTPVVINVSNSNKTNNNVSSIDGHEEEDYDDTDTKPDEQTPTHYSKLNVTSMKVAELKKELELRKLNYRGVMVQLKARLKAALEREENEEKCANVKDDSKMLVEDVAIQEPVSKLSNEEKETYKKIYTLPNSPHILVHLNKHIGDTQYKFRTTSLHTLLSYHDEKLEEPTFELAIFAKQFLQMIRRDAIFNVFKNINTSQNEDFLAKNGSKKSSTNVTTFKRTVNRQLLLSCVIIDKDRTSRIAIDELKFMFASLGICLSESQLDGTLDKLKKFVDSNKMFNYRQLTDKELSKDEEISNLINSDVIGEDLDYIKELAMGNKALFESELPLDIGNESEEVERLKNQLDKSERYRQELEIRLSCVKEEAEKSVSEMLRIKKELDHYHDLSQDYRSRYHDEKERKDQYKRLSDRCTSDFTAVKKRLNGVLDFVSYSIEHQNKNNPTSKKNADKETSKSSSKEKIIKNSNSTKNVPENKKDINSDKIHNDDIEDGGCDIIILEEGETTVQNIVIDENVDNIEPECVDDAEAECVDNTEPVGIDIINGEDESNMENDEDALNMENDEDALNMENDEDALNMENDEDALNMENDEDTLNMENDEDALNMENDEDALNMENDEDESNMENDEADLNEDDTSKMEVEIVNETNNLPDNQVPDDAPEGE